jgi:FtsZ-binding cell division protein ZapB
MLQGYGDAVLQAEALEEQLVKARKHSAMLQSKLDGAFAQYHNEVQDMQAKSDELVRKNKSLRNKNKGTCCLVEYLLGVPCSSLSHPILQGKPNASHMCARIIYTHMIRQNESNTIAVTKRTRV